MRARLAPTVLAVLLLLAACRVPAEPTPPPTTPTLAATATPAATPTPALAGDVRTPTPAPTPNLPPVTSPAWARDMILYQVFVRSFADSNGDGLGDLNGIAQQLDYLKELGVNTLWLTPVFAAPSYHGYDTTDYYTINPEFGTRDDLIKLVDEAHTRGIRVMLDFVAGHTSNQHPFFKDALGRPDSKYAEFYRWTDAGHTKYEGFASLAELPSLNHASPAVQQYLIDVAKYWLDLDGDGDYKDGIAGFRADYALGVSHDFWKRLRREIKVVNPDALLLAEVWRGGALELRPYFLDEFDAAFDFPLYGALQGNHDRIGDGVLPGQASPQLVQGELLVAPRVYPPGALRVGFINNHDTNRAMSDLGGDPTRGRTAASLLFTMPPPPMIYYGEEIGMQGVKGGEGVWDIPRREPMDWYTAEEGAGMTRWWRPAGRNNKPNDGVSVEEQRGKSGSLLEHYKGLARLRRESSALRTGTYEPVRAEPADKALAFVRRTEGDTVLAVFNFGPDPATVKLDLSETGLVYAAYAATDALTGQPVPDVRSPSHQIELPAAGSTILKLKPR